MATRAGRDRSDGGGGKNDGTRRQVAANAPIAGVPAQTVPTQTLPSSRLSYALLQRGLQGPGPG